MATTLAVLDKLVAVAGFHNTNSNISNRGTGDDNDAYIHLMLGPWRDLKRPWLVQSEANVRRERRKLPDPPCTTCKGTGRVTCRRCGGRGRTNFVELAMLPKGEWPNWCGDCKGSGMDFCDRCLGTGQRRGVLGFHIHQEEENNGMSQERQ